MIKPITTVSFAMLLTSCSQDPGAGPCQETTIHVGVTEDIAGVYQMKWKMHPAILTREDGHAESLMTDERGRNLADEISTDRTQCSTDSQGVSNCKSCITENGVERCETWSNPRFVNITPISHWEPDPNSSFDVVWDPPRTGPASLQRLARNILIEPGVYTSLTLSVIGEPYIQDTYVELRDGRRCELRVLGEDGQPSITVPINLAVRKKNDFTVEVRLALVHNIDPAGCTLGYDAQATPASVEIFPTPKDKLNFPTL